MRRHTAAIVWAGPGRVFAPGRVVSGPNGEVLAVERHRGRVQYAAIVPGLVNAHLHAQIEPLRRQVRSFVPWLRAVLKARGVTQPSDWKQSAEASIERMLRGGCTAIGEIDSTGESVEAVRRQAIAGRCYQEIVGFDVDARRAPGVLRGRRRPGSVRCLQGLSPHAPYSVSDALLRASARAARSLSVHVAESREEVEFLATGRGPFRDLLEDLGRYPARAPKKPRTAVDWLAAAGALRPETSLVHCQHLTPDDVRRIAQAGSSIVVCPGTIRYFRRTAPPVREWLDAGIPVALGTDSRASNARGDMLGELSQARRVWADLDPETILHMATASGGRALARPSLGRLCAGGPADYIALSWNAATTYPELVDAMTSDRVSVEGVWLRGVRWKSRNFAAYGDASG